MLVEHFVVHDVPEEENGKTQSAEAQQCLVNICKWSWDSHNLPQSVDHELLLLFAHPDRQQGPDLTQGGQQVDGVLDRGGADGVGLPHGPQQLPDAVVLPPQEAEHLADQLRVLDVTLLSPAHHGLGDEFLQVG